MAFKEINIFGVSFLDLLSGALGAVLILFVIVPKLTAEQQQVLEQIESLEADLAQLEELLVQAEAGIPAELYEQIRAQMEQMEQRVESLNRQLRELQEENSRLSQENRELREELEHTRNELERIRQQQQTDTNRNVSDGKMFGMSAKLGIVCMWPENVDVDLYVKDLNSGEICFWNRKNTRFGNLLEDVQSRTSTDDDRYELFYQTEIVPGRYQVYVNIYTHANRPWNGTPATVDGYAVMLPGTAQEHKIPFRTIRLTSAGTDTNIGVLEVTSNSIRLTE